MYHFVIDSENKGYKNPVGVTTFFDGTVANNINILETEYFSFVCNDLKVKNLSFDAEGTSLFALRKSTVNCLIINTSLEGLSIIDSNVHFLVVNFPIERVRLRVDQVIEHEQNLNYNELQIIY